MEGFIKVKKITNEDVFKGKFKLAFEEECNEPKTSASIEENDFRLYCDPKADGFQEIICSTRSRRVFIGSCVLLFPNFPIKKEREKGLWKTYKCTAYREIHKIY